jgi:hypothetical protein
MVELYLHSPICLHYLIKYRDNFTFFVVQKLGTNFLPCDLSPERPADNWSSNSSIFDSDHPFLSDWLLMKHREPTSYKLIAKYHVKHEHRNINSHQARPY